MRHTDRFVHASLDHLIKYTVQTTSRYYHRTMPGSFHQGFIRIHAQAGLSIAFTTRGMAAKAVRFHDWYYLFFKADLVLAAATDQDETCQGQGK